MKEEEIRKAINHYEKLKEEKRNLLQLKKEIQLLEKNEYVKKYIELTNKQNSRIKREDEIVSQSFLGLDFSQDKSNIYTYLGAFSKNVLFNGTQDFFAKNEEESDYLVYKNLEDYSDMIKISPKEKTTFEQGKIIIYFNYLLQYTKNYNNLRCFYLKKLLEEKSPQNILKDIKRKTKKFEIKEIKTN